MARREQSADTSVNIPKQLAAEVREHVGSREMSAFAARAIRHELERERLGVFLEELERELGPVDEEAVEEIVAEWPDS
jgi:Arc/MetJ-type ribon-helix-helix transcriptional regulator